MVRLVLERTEGGFIQVHGNGQYCVFVEDEAEWVEHGCEIMQFIGLTDSHGLEICQSDILRTPNGYWGVVVWNEPFFELTISETASSLYTREWLSSCTIIGNIYANPEYSLTNT